MARLICLSNNCGVRCGIVAMLGVEVVVCWVLGYCFGCRKFVVAVVLCCCVWFWSADCCYLCGVEVYGCIAGMHGEVYDMNWMWSGV